MRSTFCEIPIDGRSSEGARTDSKNLYMTRYTEPIYGNAMTVLVEVTFEMSSTLTVCAFFSHSIALFLTNAPSFYIAAFDIHFVVLIHINSSHADAQAHISSYEQTRDCITTSNSSTSNKKINGLTEHRINIFVG